MAYTQQERQFLARAIGEDANRRRVNESALIEELVDLLMRSKADQDTEIARLVGEMERRKVDQLSTFDAEVLTTRVRLEDEAAQLAALKAKVRP